MSLITITRQSAGRDRRGFTMVEMALVFVIIGILTAAGIPKIRRTIQANQVRRSAVLVAADLEQAFTIAGRYRKPVRFSCVGGLAGQVCGSGSYTIADRTGGTVRLSRNLRADGDLGIMTVTFSANPVDIFPSGIATAPDTVRITSGISTRRVIMTSAGQVRILP